ncbi:MAG TPA: MBG domain-containing protein [Nocardioides sp.]|uniref:MBG domain-containing protein n=1 Tax=uncultured Nocardioides sp. TaxID=198441 RepID=UPI002633865A|nr:MBG domain-containing protein [uncultured Nocardioides sp.]HRI96308.1 MBG domain-containing protein [Nocardioides sp.]HRK46097.1 MBG domain-containing protein [Nocardioides sp.]
MYIAPASVYASTLGAVYGLWLSGTLSIAVPFTIPFLIFGVNAVLIVVASVVAAIVLGINVADEAALPGKLAQLVVGARDIEVDAAQLAGTPEGLTSLFMMFDGATMQTLDWTRTCDNGALPPTSWAFDADVTQPEFVPLGHAEQETSPVQPSGCLNPPPIAPASASDPPWVVQRQGGSTQQQLASIETAVPGVEATQKVRVAGQWFVNRAQFEKGQSVLSKSLRLAYTDWDGQARMTWLRRDSAGGYQFIGIRPEAEGSSSGASLDPETCDEDGTCWTDDHIEYVGADGQNYSARLQPYLAPVGSPKVLTQSPVVGKPVEFRANEFAPTNATGNVTYSWRFQRTGCGMPCITAVIGPDGSPLPSYATPPSGGSGPWYIWQQAGTFQVELTATDAAGKKAVRTFPVTVAPVAPKVTAQVKCTETVALCQVRSGEIGRPVSVTGTITLPGVHENQAFKIDWGDGTSDQAEAGPNVINFDNPSAPLSGKVDPQKASQVLLTGKHTYAKPGVYYGTVTSSNWGGGTGTASFTTTIAGPSSITFPAIDNRKYGETVPMTATGTPSGQPVTYTAAPASVCQATGFNGSDIKLVGIGRCTVTAKQAAAPPLFTAAPNVQRAFDVGRAPLTITPDDTSSAYGAPMAGLTATFDGLVNGDTKAAITGLVLSGPQALSDAGTYPITAAGATSSKYDISYGPSSTYRVLPARLIVRVADASKTYGARNPYFGYTVEGLVDGDTLAHITGIRVDGPAATSGAGSFPLRGSGGTNPNYAYDFVDGTLTVRKAPLRITADDAQSRYGAAAPAFTARFEGLVNGDTKGDIAELTLTGAPAGSDAGTYPITASGAISPNYDISYVAGTHTVTPAPLRITVEDQQSRYGAAGPTLTARFEGLVNGDTQDDLAGLTLTGPLAGSDAGSYSITASGAVDPNYDIRYVAGTHTITRAPLTIAADDQRQTYGAAAPTLTATYDGLVNGDTSADLAGLVLTGPSAGAHVGSYPITASGASDPNYAITFRPGTLQVTKAPLRITADDKTTIYGDPAPVFTATFAGLANGDTQASLPGLVIAGAPAGSPVGSYPIVASGAVNPDYDITYVNGTHKVTPPSSSDPGLGNQGPNASGPRLSLSQTGLPASVVKHATIDGVTVTLPATVPVASGQTHRYAFPPMVANRRGVLYLTTEPAFAGPVTGNVTATAAYTSMAKFLAKFRQHRAISAQLARTLKATWRSVEVRIKTGRARTAVPALRTFQKQVKAAPRKQLKPATAKQLRTYTRLVRTNLTTPTDPRTVDPLV